MEFTDDNLSGLTIAACSALAQCEPIKFLQRNGIRCIELDPLQALAAEQPALLLFDSESWQRYGARLPKNHGALIGCEEGQEVPADLFLPRGLPLISSLRNIEFGLSSWLLRQEHRNISRHLEDKNSHLERLAEIGIALSAEKDLSALLDRILLEGRELACCDAASLFLVNEDEQGERELVFKLAQNASLMCDFQEQRFKLDESSVVGYVAIHNTELAIDDAYQIPTDAPYRFNRSFDQQTGYRSVSLLAIPVRNHLEEVIGVLQFINRTRESGIRLTRPELALEQTIAFDEEIRVLLRALASQSAIAIENRALIENIKKLFDGFVSASVIAIEQRDPATSGHSFRVADLCNQLAHVLPRSGVSKYQKTTFSEKDLRQMRYAALLHDFGKVGVRESVLVKPKKLTMHQYDVIRLRIMLSQKNLHNQALEKCLEIMQQGGGEMDCRLVNEAANEEIERLEQFWLSIKEANEPKILPEETAADLKRIHRYQALDIMGGTSPLIDNRELFALSIPKGSLTAEERQEIESHVTHTENFLRMIPWTPELSDVPEIAAAHHEKLNGTGYPKGLAAEQIPLPSKIMAICDIYDALTASDRPYKSAVPQEIAFKILRSEAEGMLLDQELVGIFIEANVSRVIENRDYSNAASRPSMFHRHVCDVEFDEACFEAGCQAHQKS